MSTPFRFELPDPFIPERDTRILNEVLRNLQGILSGGVEGVNIRPGGVGSGSLAPGAVTDDALTDDQPAGPSSISGTTGLNNATSIAYIDLTWSQPPGVTAATWEIRWRRQGATGADAVYRYRMVGQQQFRIENLRSGVNYEIGVDAISRTGIRSGYAPADYVRITQAGGQPPPEVNLVVDKLLAGSLAAQVLLSGNIRTADSGARVHMDSTGIKLYDSAGVVVVNLNTTTGLPSIVGGTIIGTTIATAVSGQRIAISKDWTDQVRMYTGDAAENNFGQIGSLVTGSGATRQLTTYFRSPLTSASGGWAMQTMRSRSPGGTVKASIDLAAMIGAGEVSLVEILETEIGIYTTGAGLRFASAGMECNSNLSLEDFQLRLRAASDPNHFLQYVTNGGVWDGVRVQGFKSVHLTTNGGQDRLIIDDAGGIAESSVWINIVGGGLKRISEGASNSAGAGFRQLRVAN